MSLVQDPGIYFDHINKMPKHFDVQTVCLHICVIQGNQHIIKVYVAHAFIVYWNNFGAWNTFHDLTFVAPLINRTYRFYTNSVWNKMDNAVIQPFDNNNLGVVVNTVINWPPLLFAEVFR